MVDTRSDSRSNVRKFVLRAVKAAVKGVIFCVAYFVISLFLAPVAEIIPGFQQMVETFVMIYIVLMIFGELTSDTIFQYFFGASKALFVIGYMMYSLQGGVYGMSFENVTLAIDLRLFLMIALILGLLGFAKTVLQAINYMNEKAEPPPLL